MKKILIGLIILLILPHFAFAGEFRRNGEDYRSLAMGNTGIVTATGSSAMFYNPAAMGNIRTWWFDFPMIEVTLSDDARSLYETAQSGGFNLETQQDQFDFMESFVGQNPYVKVQFGSNLLINLDKKGFTIGANYTYEAILDIEVRNPSLPEIETFMRLDHVRQYGLSMPIGLGKWLIGATVKSVERQEIEFTYGMADAINEEPFPTLASDGTSGKGSGYDVGVLYRQASKSRVMWGFVYKEAIELGDATPIPEEYALGVGMVHEFSGFKFTGAMDIRDLTFAQGTDTSLARRTHMGVELGFLPYNDNLNFLSARYGYNGAYPSQGLEVAFGRGMVLGYTIYSAETGEYSGQKESRRTVYYLSFGF